MQTQMPRSTQNWSSRNLSANSQPEMPQCNRSVRWIGANAAKKTKQITKLRVDEPRADRRRPLKYPCFSWLVSVMLGLFRGSLREYRHHARFALGARALGGGRGDDQFYTQIRQSFVGTIVVGRFMGRMFRGVRFKLGPPLVLGPRLINSGCPTVVKIVVSAADRQ